jgi:ubiquitin carboxyl-terminal hydrolase 25/28
MHSGQADSGHYYAYIYDRGSDQWHKFSDSLVEVELEEEVMANAAGGEGHASAYCFVYVKPGTLHPTVKSV